MSGNRWSDRFQGNGHADLERFFEHYASQNQFKLHLALTVDVRAQGVDIGMALLRHVLGVAIEQRDRWDAWAW